MIEVTDDRGRRLELERAPQRIVSLVPSDTFSLFHLGAGERVVGRTDYCVAPEGVSRIPSVGGTKNPSIAKIRELHPDLVVANQEENTQRDIEKLLETLPTYVSFPKRSADSVSHLERLWQALGQPAAGAEPLRVAAAAFREARTWSANVDPVGVFAPIWMDPLMTISDDTYISSVLELCGGANVFGDRRRRYPLAADLGRAPSMTDEQVGLRDVRYPRVTLEEVSDRAPEVILLSDEPHPFTLADAAVFASLDTPASRTGRILFCDGKDLSWYGARSLLGLKRLRALLHPSA